MVNKNTNPKETGFLCSYFPRPLFLKKNRTSSLKLYRFVEKVSFIPYQGIKILIYIVRQSVIKKNCYIYILM